MIVRPHLPPFRCSPLQLVTSEPRPRRQGTSSTSVSAAGAEHDSSALCPPGEFHRELSSNSQRSADSHPDLPQAPDDASPMEEGVVVEAVDDTFYVKVHCKDRAGLLADIVRALKTMPLEVGGWGRQGWKPGNRDAGREKKQPWGVGVLNYRSAWAGDMNRGFNA